MCRIQALKTTGCWPEAPKRIYIFLIKINLYWSIVALQCGVSLCGTGEWISSLCTWSPLFVISFLSRSLQSWEMSSILYSRFYFIHSSVYIYQPQSPKSSPPSLSRWHLYVCPTLCDPMDYTVHGILQVRILEWVASPFSRGSSQSRDWTQVSRIAGGFFTSWATREAHGCFLHLCK